MIHLLQSQDGSQDLHLDSRTAGYLRHALCQASPRGVCPVQIRGQVLRVHVHAESAPAPEEHVAIENR